MEDQDTWKSLLWRRFILFIFDEYLFNKSLNIPLFLLLIFESAHWVHSTCLTISLFRNYTELFYTIYIVALKNWIFCIKTLKLCGSIMFAQFLMLECNDLWEVKLRVYELRNFQNLYSTILWEMKLRV